MLLYYITDRTRFSGSEPERRERLLEKIADAARVGIDYVQLREKDLSGRELESLARAAARNIRANGRQTRLLMNSRTDIALAVNADGTHLRSKDISPEDVRKIWREAHRSRGAQGAKPPIIAVSCHNSEEVIAAKAAGTDFVVFGPVFEKMGCREVATGIDLLHSVSRHRIPVLALGGVTPDNARLCLEAGASGIAGIRLFQEADLSEVVKRLRS